MKYKHLLLVAFLLPILSGCNNSDDVARIFLDKTWQLTDILEGNSSSDYWNGNKEAKEASLKLIGVGDNFTITFTGTVDGNSISGALSGKATSTTYTGNWRANGEKNTFISSANPITDRDVLGRAFLDALNHATSYSGDENNLYIYFKEGQRTKRLLLHVQ
ncbi:DUF4847 family protein [uncultured Bacteroides sp.]|uniref:DUF4847 family protein n=1 Tax=uncultured Bacteroides sp. TaxID=162156 RepID=UPI002AAB8F08|nr:DUF4847 family protein [uncultured Bacteroides sp.]